MVFLFVSPIETRVINQVYSYFWHVLKLSIVSTNKNIKDEVKK